MELTFFVVKNVVPFWGDDVRCHRWHPNSGESRDSHSLPVVFEYTTTFDQCNLGNVETWYKERYSHTYFLHFFAILEIHKERLIWKWRNGKKDQQFPSPFFVLFPLPCFNQLRKATGQWLPGVDRTATWFLPDLWTSSTPFSHKKHPKKTQQKWRFSKGFMKGDCWLVVNSCSLKTNKYHCNC